MMYSITLILTLFHTEIWALYNIRVAEVQLYHDAKYIPGYHLHTIGNYPMSTLVDCIYLCQNNDYCRTANYFNSETGSLCSLFEENSFVGQIVSISSSMSIVISFNLCPNGISEPAYLCFGLPTNNQAPVTVQHAMNNLLFHSTMVNTHVLSYHSNQSDLCTIIFYGNCSNIWMAIVGLH